MSQHISQLETSSRTVQAYSLMPEHFAEHFADFRSTLEDFTLAHELAGVALGDSRVVEIGCGDGRDAADTFVPNSAHYVGYDPSEGFLNLARQRFVGADPTKVRFELGYAQSTDYGQDNDIAMAVNSILHVPQTDLSVVFRRVGAGLRQGGVFYLITKTEADEKDEVYVDHVDGDESRQVERTFYYHSPERLTCEAERVGLVVGHCEISLMDDRPWDWLQFAVTKS